MPTPIRQALTAMIASTWLLVPADTGATVPEVPGDDIFGFTSPTDLGNVGDTGFANENDGRTGKRQGSYGAINAKYELGRTIAADWWLGGALFGAGHHSRHVPDLPDVNRVTFDGLSFEIAHRLIKRSATNPLALTVSMEPRWSRVDGTSGLTSNGVNVAFKLFLDAVVVPERLYWAANVQWAPQIAEDPLDHSQTVKSSSTLVSSALAYQISPTVLAGIEARFLANFSSLLARHEVGRALYAGPTMLVKITDKVAFNATVQPQIAGRSIANPAARLDLDTFERLQFRAKLTTAFD